MSSDEENYRMIYEDDDSIESTDCTVRPYYFVEDPQHNLDSISDRSDDSDDSSSSDSDDSDSSDDINFADSSSRCKKQDAYEELMFRDMCRRQNFDFDGVIKATYSCEHYRNFCKIICSECPKDDNVFCCHKCHNEIMLERSVQTRQANSSTGDDKKQRKDVKNHELASSQIEKIMCLKCDHVQRFRRECEKCRIKFGSYICFKCRLIDNRNTSSVKQHYYHCNECGCCLVGKRRNYKHCAQCGVCVQKTMYDKHICRVGGLDPDRLCSICQSGVRSQTSVIMRCGHVVHQDCYHQLIKSTYKCPECMKSIVDTKKIFSKIAREIEQTPLHTDLQKKIKIHCNDCGSNSDVDYHYIGNRCSNRRCKSFNTYEL